LQLVYDVFENPRCHTGLGYKTRERLRIQQQARGKLFCYSCNKQFSSYGQLSQQLHGNPSCQKVGEDATEEKDAVATLKELKAERAEIDKQINSLESVVGAFEKRRREEEMKRKRE